MRMKLSLFRTSVGLSILSVLSMAVSAHATHIQYVDRDSSIGSSGLEIAAGSSYFIIFDLKHDSMDLWKLAVGSSNAYSTNSQPSDDNSIGTGSYDPDYALHYVYLRVDPANIEGTSTSSYLSLNINGQSISTWSNPIKLYDWCMVSGCGCGCSCSISDPYHIADNDYLVSISLTNHSDKTITITNVNIEGCFDAAPVPEPSTVFLFITGLAGLCWMKFLHCS